MSAHRPFISFALFFLVLSLAASPATAGFAVRLEKEVPAAAISSVNPIKVKIFSSQTDAGAVAEQRFGVGDLMVSMLDTLSGATMYRVHLDFTSTDTLNSNMHLWWEFSLGGEIIGARERVPQSAYALFAEEARVALTTRSVNWANITAMPADIADGDQVLEAAEVDPTVPASLKDGVQWYEIANRPAGLDNGDQAGIASESDPQVGTNTTGYVPRWSGSTLLRGTIYDNGVNVGVGTGTPTSKLDVAGEVWSDGLQADAAGVTIGGFEAFLRYSGVSYQSTGRPFWMHYRSVDNFSASAATRSPVRLNGYCKDRMSPIAGFWDQGNLSWPVPEVHAFYTHLSGGTNNGWPIPGLFAAGLYNPGTGTWTGTIYGEPQIVCMPNSMVAVNP